MAEQPKDGDAVSIHTQGGTTVSLSGDTTREIVGAFTKLVQSSIDSNDRSRTR